MTWNLPFGDEKVEPTPNLPSVANGEFAPLCGAAATPVATLKTPVALKGRDSVKDGWTVNGYYGIPYIEGETWNEFLYRLSQLFSLHGQNKDALAKTKLGSWEYDIIGPWYKCNMTDIMAAMGLVQLERYPELLKRRQWIVAKYNEAFAELPVAVLDHKGADHCSSHHLYLVRLLGKTREETNRVIERLAVKGVAANVHYKPLPMMTAYKALGFDIEDYPNAYHLFENEITLPLHTKLTDEDVEYVIASFKEAIE
ncbi:MAG: DegT/DnrJ/EryC1/StrS family aminotransferase [Prevotella sp.]|nr:DegT/DnrJ/EryC1/StrS family aminotransferase [Prevotella sp.]